MAEIITWLNTEPDRSGDRIIPKVRTKGVYDDKNKSLDEKMPFDFGVNEDKYGYYNSKGELIPFEKGGIKKWSELQEKPFEDIGKFLESDDEKKLNVVNIAKDWVEGKSYYVNDIVLYKNKLYKKKNDDNSIISFQNLNKEMFFVNPDYTQRTNTYIYNYGWAAHCKRLYFRNAEGTWKQPAADKLIYFFARFDSPRFILLVDKEIYDSGIYLFKYSVYNSNESWSNYPIYRTYEQLKSSNIGGFKFEEKKLKDIFKVYDMYYCVDYDRDSSGYGWDSWAGWQYDSTYPWQYEGRTSYSVQQLFEYFINGSQYNSIYPDESPNWELLPYLADEFKNKNVDWTEVQKKPFSKVDVDNFSVVSDTLKITNVPWNIVSEKPFSTVGDTFLEIKNDKLNGVNKLVKPFSSTAKYKPGDYALYEKKIYRCLANYPAEIDFENANPDYTYNTTNEIVAYIGGRPYQKLSKDTCWGGWTMASDGWGSPCMISLSANGVHFKADTGEGYDITYRGTVSYIGYTFYIIHDQYSMGGGLSGGRAKRIAYQNSDLNFVKEILKQAGIYEESLTPDQSLKWEEVNYLADEITNAVIKGANEWSDIQNKPFSDIDPNTLEVKNDTLTVIGGGGASSADKISYDNTTSDLEAENVQDAIDELDSTIDESKINYSLDDTGTGLNIKGGFGLEDCPEFFELIESGPWTNNPAPSTGSIDNLWTSENILGPGLYMLTNFTVFNRVGSWLNLNPKLVNYSDDFDGYFLISRNKSCNNVRYDGSGYTGFSDMFFFIVKKGTTQVRLGRYSGGSYAPNDTLASIYRINTPSVLSENKKIFSETPKIIGEWYNGKKLYEKTYHYIHTNQNEYISLEDIGISNVEEIIDIYIYTPLNVQNQSQNKPFGSNYYYNTKDLFSPYWDVTAQSFCIRCGDEWPKRPLECYLHIQYTLNGSD